MSPEEHKALATLIFEIIILVTIYVLPGLNAWRRGHHQTRSIFVLNLSLGWTILGWALALVWSSMAVKNDKDPK